MNRKAKVIFDTQIKEYGYVWDGKLYHCNLPRLHPMTATMEALSNSLDNDDDKKALSDIYVMIEVDLIPCENSLK
jgi:hypothetical protein|tara:strand:- start:17 stop:241 length:225 start_codon:yes stop_codon:yes gene_type:complete